MIVCLFIGYYLVLYVAAGRDVSRFWMVSIDGQILFVVAIGKVFRIHIMEASMIRGWAEGDKV